MKVAYFDCFAGASGDMILGSLMDVGLDLAVLQGELAKLHLSHYELGVTKVVKRGIGGSQALVRIEHDHHHHHHRHLSDIVRIIQDSYLDEPVKRRSIEIFTRLAQAEALVHRTSIDTIHFHEVGAMDAIIDVVGSCAGLAALGVEKVYCSPLHVGTGTVECAHGTLPVPAPATAELIKGKPAYSTGVQGELLTPTGAAILTTVAEDFGPMPMLAVEHVGYGAGTSDFPIPNLLRVIMGQAPDEVPEYLMERVAVAETTIDDMNPQVYDYLMEKLLQNGAFDVFLVPVHMKKNRPAIQIKVLCPVEMMGTVSDFLLRETTTIGVRWRTDDRIKADRSIRELRTMYGPIACKIARVGDRVVNVAPEYDQCKRVAREQNIPLTEVMDAARRAAADELATDGTGW